MMKKTENKMIKRSLQFLTLGFITLIIISVATAVAATNTVPSTNASELSFPVTPNDIRPSACAGLYLNDIITGSGTITGTDGNDLILGSPANDTINGMGGNDCIIGGGGDNTIDGGSGSDICIGGPGNNTFANCEGQY
jgi:Ca2+-binding RTX toxin-like protein